MSFVTFFLGSVDVEVLDRNSGSKAIGHKEKAQTSGLFAYLITTQRPNSVLAVKLMAVLIDLLFVKYLLYQAGFLAAVSAAAVVTAAVVTTAAASAALN